MRRRDLLGALGALSASGGRLRGGRRDLTTGCGCAFAPATAIPPGSEVFKDVGSKLRITGMQVFGVTLDEKIARSDRAEPGNTLGKTVRCVKGMSPSK